MNINKSKNQKCSYIRNLTEYNYNSPKDGPKFDAYDFLFKFHGIFLYLICIISSIFLLNKYQL